MTDFHWLVYCLKKHIKTIVCKGIVMNVYFFLFSFLACWDVVVSFVWNLPWMKEVSTRKNLSLSYNSNFVSTFYTLSWSIRSRKSGDFCSITSRRRLGEWIQSKGRVIDGTLISLEEWEKVRKGRGKKRDKEGSWFSVCCRVGEKGRLAMKAPEIHSN